MMFWNQVKYGLLVLKYRIEFNDYLCRLRRLLKVRIECFIIERRFQKKGLSDDKKMFIMSRFFQYKMYREMKESHICRRTIGQFIAAHSEKTGIPQWQLREILQKDFYLDI